ncbi:MULTISPECIES: YebC/PmpR family DNA-binding transcriptional regulator [Mesonia]|uniref:Transcriptional regulatory protein YebC n=1 Tax=Mesonia oceanica TaxID=2687242 RepID=A0AC61Y301_9FLAO|nr:MULTISPECIES: YebC/PmpR family DNA-binding transcriptional regulator [Mesonia]MAN28582.1 YebC/PmpR family DNA-binding transcriptional regulator [Mesonia sp.]MAQ41263.1 YebC/PmpR family DNA-binding transcriptional regulator [Mesonia sp.]MBJ97362.1 YebC/PmpR family DNA-binding transcriptional regulator [Flavobacteriaceae bacterium]VVU98836.1 putative transcriptional regulatory protein YebC [Mesonia oceanica]|tara:strand:- start:1592 stop:2353 length:762 start_codon:yes stop_codon:yes gene_type:complete
MAGHSKWANIKHRKGAQDKKRAKQFTRAIKEITVAVKEGGGPDPEANPTLRNAIANAKGVNMPKDTIERAIKKASGTDADNYETVTFEGYGPNGIAFFIECTTDNTNRTVASVRSIFTKNGGSLGTNGSLEFLFDRKGVFTIERGKIEMTLEELELELIEGGAEDFEESDDFITIYTDFVDFGKMSETLEKLNIEVKNSELQRIPTNTNELNIEDGKKIMSLVDKFEEDDDVQNVFHTLEITDELAEALDEED